MVSKNNTRLYDEKMNKNKFKYSIRKLNVGVASVLIGVTFGLGALAATASADEVNQAQTTEVSTPVKASATEEGETTSVVSTQAQQEETTASADDATATESSNAEAQTTTFNVADFAQNNAVSADMLAESKAVTTGDAEDRAAVPAENQTNPHRSYDVPDRKTSTPEYSSGDGHFANLVDDHYKIGWTQDQLSSRPNDPGFALSDDGKTLVYRLAAGDTTRFELNDILSLLYVQPEVNPNQVIWGNDKRSAENGLTDTVNGITWSQDKRNRSRFYYANGNQAMVLDIVDKNRNGDFTIDLNPNKYAGKTTTATLTIPEDNESRKVYYPGTEIKLPNENNVNYYTGADIKKGYLVATDREVNKVGYAQDVWGTKSIKFVLVPVNAAPLINVESTAKNMNLGELHHDEENKVEYYSINKEKLSDIREGLMAVSDYMDDATGATINKELEIIPAGQMQGKELYTVKMTATDSTGLTSKAEFNIVIDIDKTNLEEAIKDGKDFQKDNNYKNAVDDDKRALDNAIKNGETVKNNPTASQADVDAAKEAIDKAMNAIKDKANQASAQPT
ncbi:YSIRK-type signal peptide-containing protein, partial [Ligilactobacillus equi]